MKRIGQAVDGHCMIATHNQRAFSTVRVARTNHHDQIITGRELANETDLVILVAYQRQGGMFQQKAWQGLDQTSRHGNFAGDSTEPLKSAHGLVKTGLVQCLVGSEQISQGGFHFHGTTATRGARSNIQTSYQITIAVGRRSKLQYQNRQRDLSLLQFNNFRWNQGLSESNPATGT